jgi:hypothetical protein
MLTATPNTSTLVQMNFSPHPANLECVYVIIEYIMTLLDETRLVSAVTKSQLVKSKDRKLQKVEQFLETNMK